MALELIAPAKLNLTLEVLGRRPDGYHEIASLIQTIDLADSVRLTPAASLEVLVCGAQSTGLPADPKRNLAYRAAAALAQAVGRPELGAHIELEKCIPAGMGLGGGSSDAASVLRGLNQIWALGLDIEALSGIAASIGSDVPFFLHAGAALATGRGEIVEPLPNLTPFDLTLFVCDLEIEDKTRQMYSTIGPPDFSDGAATRAAVEAARLWQAFGAVNLRNAFDSHVSAVAPAVAETMARFRDAGLSVVTAGSGPAFFTLTRLDQMPRALLDAQRWGVSAVACRSLPREEALAIREV